MSSPLQLSLAGDYRADAVAHQAIPLAIERAARWLNITVKAEWIASEKLAESNLRRSDAVWVVPGSPYNNDEAIFDTIRWARESGKPFLGSCGGFQYAVIEYARNVLGWHDASHAETDTGGRRVIAPLSCSLVEQRGAVRFEPGSRIAAAYGTLDSDEGYHCNFGVNPEFSAALDDNTLRITAWDDAGDVRGVELPDHPFFVATLFQSERAALQEKESPLVVAWMQAALAQR
ncbi:MULTISPECIES: CTP synthase [unclassified Pantoea]|uniref:CTP synthase C-terminal region-related (seleno)protein n=1 Tax=unclassified Pantoea TaxID=2630326 RepID=UPI002477B61D|nr:MULTISPECIES: CTP synthase [unclassified Pantoea]GME43563.1 CTP synthase [Pantoea sp. QMID1]GME43651.1 CTP synthase [Pantoea sp. QMID3]GME58397.1 CTP synthase [Pantoea sp. QMID4]GME59831.1 CTP synthase [Pantoea sp. QMID2]